VIIQKKSTSFWCSNNFWCDNAFTSFYLMGLVQPERTTFDGAAHLVGQWISFSTANEVDINVKVKQAIQLPWLKVAWMCHAKTLNIPGSIWKVYQTDLCDEMADSFHAWTLLDLACSWISLSNGQSTMTLRPYTQCCCKRDMNLGPLILGVSTVEPSICFPARV
jgi:hypothetical protein